MELIESWRESLALLMPRQAKVMMLVTLKSLSDLFYNPAALLVILPLSIAIAFRMSFCSSISATTVPCFIASIVSYILVVLMILYVRPSVMLKHRFYFMNYWRHIIYVALFYTFVELINVVLPLAIPNVLWLIWAPLSTFWILFFVDSHVSIAAFVRSFIRAFKMLSYNLPVSLIITAIWHFIFILLSIVAAQLVEIFFNVQSYILFFLVSAVFGIIFFPLWYCLMSNFYVKRLHDQFSLYFGRPLS